MRGRRQPHYVRLVYMDLSGERCDVQKPLPLFITGAFACTGAPYFTNCNHPATSPHPLPAPHSARIRKNSFHYHSLTKGHIRQCGVASASTDASSRLTHPLAVLCVPLSTCTAPPFPPPLWLFNSWHYLSLSPELHALPTPT